ncbi:MAG: hypothetical protein K2V38_18175 [Gemmataceae bacterium]|nr:hypothetical protein [Gemmataceae bacterium]
MAKQPVGPAHQEPAALSVSDMAARCGLSRSRFHVLVSAGVFPQPRRAAGRRPYYSHDLIERCLEVRRTGVGVNGTVVMFNRRGRRTLGS